MSMTVADLIAELEQMPEDAEVRLAIQPQWAFEHSVRSVALVEDDDPTSRGPASVVYIGEGEQLGYLSREASEAVWS